MLCFLMGPPFISYQGGVIYPGDCRRCGRARMPMRGAMRARPYIMLRVKPYLYAQYRVISADSPPARHAY